MAQEDTEQATNGREPQDASRLIKVSETHGVEEDQVQENDTSLRGNNETTIEIDHGDKPNECGRNQLAESTTIIGAQRDGPDSASGDAGEKAMKCPLELIVTNLGDKRRAESDGQIKDARQSGRGRDARRKGSADLQASTKTGHIRHIIALLALSSIVLANLNRQAYNQALVRMARRDSKHKLPETGDGVEDNTSAGAEATPDHVTAFPDVEDSNFTHEPNANTEDRTTRVEPDQGFEWTGAQISLLQAGFSYGYTFFMIPGGRLSEIYGAKWVIFLSSFGSALCSFMTPFLANTSVTLLFASRVFMGLSQTGVSPALYALLSRWLPPDESSVYLPMIKVGVMIGFMAGSMINGFLPWQFMFYILGLVGLAWSALWAFFASSLPGEHKFMSKEELAYIQHCLERRDNSWKPKGASGAAKEKTRRRSKSAPWLRIIKNPVVLAFAFTKFTVKLSTDAQTTQVPRYLSQVFQISDQLNGLLNGANFAIQAVFTGAVAYVANQMVVNKQFGLNKTGIRRLFQGINCFGMSLAYLLISFNMGSLNLACGAVILLSVSSMFGAGGEAVLPLDLTTEYSASIMAIANSVANMSGIVLPPMVLLFLANQPTSSENWNHAWWFVSAIMAGGGLMFTLVVRAKIQGFNEGKKVKKQEADVGAESSELDGKGANKMVRWMSIEMSPTKASNP